MPFTTRRCDCAATAASAAGEAQAAAAAHLLQATSVLPRRSSSILGVTRQTPAHSRSRSEAVGGGGGGRGLPVVVAPFLPRPVSFPSTSPSLWPLGHRMGASGSQRNPSYPGSGGTTTHRSVSMRANCALALDLTDGRLSTASRGGCMYEMRQLGYWHWPRTADSPAEALAFVPLRCLSNC